MAIKDLEKNKSQIEDLKLYTINKLKEGIPGVEFNGNSADFDKSLYTLLNVRLPFYDVLIGFELELKGVAVSQGCACSLGDSYASEVIVSLLNDDEINSSTPL